MTNEEYFLISKYENIFGKKNKHMLIKQKLFSIKKKNLKKRCVSITKGVASC